MTARKILVVDDDHRLLRLMELSLQRAGYRVVAAVTGELGVDKVRTERPDLVLMDVMMPGIDGFETTKRIRRMPEGRHIPIIFLSSVTETSAKVKGLRGGGDDYVTKPVKMSELLARIEAHLRSISPVSGQLVTVFGSRAGVGTTTLVVNLALALHRVAQKKVMLVDWRRPLGDVALFLGMSGAPALESLLSRIDEVSDKMFMDVQEYALGIQVVLGAADRNSAAQMDQKALGSVLDIALVKADFVLVDMGPFFSWNTLPLVGKEDGINLCVFTPTTLSIKRAAQALETVDVMSHYFWLILNQYDAQSMPHEQIEAQLRTVLQGCVPDESEQVTRALAEGNPLYAINPGSGFARALDVIARRVCETLEP